MIVRLKFRLGNAVSRKPRKNQKLALACAALLMPAALMAYVLAVWGLTSDIGATSPFAMTGLFSHWQVWILGAGLMHLTAYVLNRYGTGHPDVIPRSLLVRFGKPRPESR
jgi:CHASE2 domain-containing sensor protein